MNQGSFARMSAGELEQLNGGSVLGGIGVLGATVGATSAIVGGGSGLLLGVGVVAAAAPAAVVVAVAGAAIGGVMIGKGIVDKKL